MRFDAGHVARLRDVGLDDLAIVDLVNSGAFFSWANRLMLSLGEPTDAARWATVPNTVLTPHTAGATTEAVQGMLMLLLQNLSAHFAGEPLKTPVTT